MLKSGYKSGADAQDTDKKPEMLYSAGMAGNLRLQIFGNFTSALPFQNFLVTLPRTVGIADQTPSFSGQLKQSNLFWKHQFEILQDKFKSDYRQLIVAKEVFLKGIFSDFPDARLETITENFVNRISQYLFLYQKLIIASSFNKGLENPAKSLWILINFLDKTNVELSSKYLINRKNILLVHSFYPKIYQILSLLEKNSKQLLELKIDTGVMNSAPFWKLYFEYFNIASKNDLEIFPVNEGERILLGAMNSIHGKNDSESENFKYQFHGAALIIYFYSQNYLTALKYYDYLADLYLSGKANYINSVIFKFSHRILQLFSCLLLTKLAPAKKLIERARNLAIIIKKNKNDLSEIPFCSLNSSFEIFFVAIKCGLEHHDEILLKIANFIDQAGKTLVRKKKPKKKHYATGDRTPVSWGQVGENRAPLAFALPTPSPRAFGSADAQGIKMVDKLERPSVMALHPPESQPTQRISAREIKIAKEDKKLRWEYKNLKQQKKKITSTDWPRLPAEEIMYELTSPLSLGDSIKAILSMELRESLHPDLVYTAVKALVEGVIGVTKKLKPVTKKERLKRKLTEETALKIKAWVAKGEYRGQLLRIYGEWGIYKNYPCVFFKHWLPKPHHGKENVYVQKKASKGEHRLGDGSPYRKILFS